MENILDQIAQTPSEEGELLDLTGMENHLESGERNFNRIIFPVEIILYPTLRRNPSPRQAKAENLVTEIRPNLVRFKTELQKALGKEKLYLFYTQNITHNLLLTQCLAPMKETIVVPPNLSTKVLILRHRPLCSLATAGQPTTSLQPGDVDTSVQEFRPCTTTHLQLYGNHSPCLDLMKRIPWYLKYTCATFVSPYGFHALHLNLVTWNFSRMHFGLAPTYEC